MNFDDIRQLSEDELNRHLEEVAGRRWTLETFPVTGGRLFRYISADGGETYSTVPHLHVSASWDACMALANEAHITRRNEPIVHGDPDSARIWLYHCWAPDWMDGRCITVPESVDAQEQRIAIARLYLWWKSF